MVPIIDWHEYASGKSPDRVAFDVGQAARDVGAFVLVDHGIPRGLLTDVLRSAADVFDLSGPQKAPLSAGPNFLARGWRDGLAEGGKGDRGEGFRIGPMVPPESSADPFRSPNIWPDIDGFRDVLRDAHKDLSALSLGLIHAIERDLGIGRGELETHFARPLSTLDLVRLPSGARLGDVGASQLCAPSALSMMILEENAGVAVYDRSGDWRDVPDVRGGLLVRVGDCLTRWSNAAYHAAPVQARGKSGALCACFALIPQEASVLAPLPRTGEPLYSPVTVADFLSGGDATGKVSAAE